MQYLGRVIFRSRNLIISSLLFVIVVIQLIVLMPKDTVPFDERPASSDVTKPDPAMGLPSDFKSGQVVLDAKMIETKPEGKAMELWAARAFRPKDVGELTLETVKVKFYASNGVVYTVTGKTGGVDPDTYAMWVKGDVLTKSSNGYTFRTQSVFYDSKLKRLHSPNEVEMDGPAEVNGSRLELTGEDMSADLVSNQLKVNRKVRANRKVPGERVAKIQSNSALFSGQTNSAEFTGSVIMDLDTMRVTGPKAQFAYDPKSGQLESVMVAGGVRVTDSNKYATSGSLAVFFRDDRYVFRGSPRVVQNEDELIGDEIVFMDGGKKVQVLNARAQIDPARAQEPPKKEKAP